MSDAPSGGAEGGPDAPAAGASCLVHATAIAVGDRAALIRGPSGSGKSDLALRCLTLPATPPLWPLRAMLVADDQVRVTRAGQTLSIAPPPTIAGLIEVRGVGIVAVDHAPSARLALCVTLVGPDVRPGEEIARLPDEDESVEILGVHVPHMRLRPFEASAAAKLLTRLAFGEQSPPQAGT